MLATQRSQQFTSEEIAMVSHFGSVTGTELFLMINTITTDKICVLPRVFYALQQLGKMFVYNFLVFLRK